jgi:hypothetical protein
MLRTVSFSPIELNTMIGGSVLTIVKKECGARLSMPDGLLDETQAIGRGTTRLPRRG